MSLPQTACAVPFGKYHQLFPNYRAVIHHGGIGVTFAALRAGVPAIVVTFGHDQEDNGLRVQALGAGQLIPRTKTKSRLVTALEQILSPNIQHAAATLGKKIRQDKDGASAVADIIVQQINAR